MILSLTNVRRNALLLLFLFIYISASGQRIRLCSWNLKDFGKSKTAEQIDFIANTVKDFDVIAIQEVVAGYGGPQAVIRLVEVLNKNQEIWDYTFSHGTSSDRYSKERYAFIWKKQKLRLSGEPWLEAQYNLEIEREPYYVRFISGKKTFTVGTFHAKPKSKQPETEIKYFKFLPGQYPKDLLIFCGDFNLPQSHSVFNPLRNMGYTSALTAQKTSLRQKCIQQDCLASEYDNFYFPAAKVKLLNSGIIHFYNSFVDIKEARKLSDHVPVFMDFFLN